MRCAATRCCERLQRQEAVAIAVQSNSPAVLHQGKNERHDTVASSHSSSSKCTTDEQIVQ